MALPNGKYEVTCFFAFDGDEPVEINLIANVEREKRVQIPIGIKNAKMRFNVTIIDERLTQVIYVGRKRGFRR